MAKTNAKAKKKKWKRASKTDIEELSKGTLILDSLSLEDCLLFSELLSLTDCLENYPDIPLKQEIFYEEEKEN